MSCKHESFEAFVSVARLEDTGRFLAEIRIQCRDCGVPMQFKGLEPGYDAEGARVSLDGLEARIGIHPQGERPDPLQQMMGIKVTDYN